MSSSDSSFSSTASSFLDSGAASAAAATGAAAAKASGLAIRSLICERPDDDQSIVAKQRGHSGMVCVIRGIGFSACVDENQLADVGIFSVIFLLIILSK